MDAESSPPPVHSVNRTSATRRGSTQPGPFRERAARRRVERRNVDRDGLEQTAQLAAERPYIRLVREENEQEDEQAIHKAVRTLNEAICTLDDELDQKPLPMATGQTEKSCDPDASRPRVSWVHRLPDGEEVIIMVSATALGLVRAQGSRRIDDRALRLLLLSLTLVRRTRS